MLRAILLGPPSFDDFEETALAANIEAAQELAKWEVQDRANGLSSAGKASASAKYYRALAVGL